MGDEGETSIKAYRSWVDGYIVRIMTPQDARIVQDWFSTVGVISRWDIDTAISVYPPAMKGFYIGERKGELVASTIRIPWGNVYYGSMYFVAEEHRGKGYGTRLRDQVAFSHVGNNILVVDAVQGKVAETNKKYGYKDTATSGRYQGVAKETVPGVQCSCKILPVKDVAFDDVITYDNKCFIVKDFPIRRAFLEKWTAIPGGAAYVALDDKGTVVGFGCRRPCIPKDHHMVGPLYSDSPEIAEALLQRLCQDVVGTNVTVNIWYQNEAAVAMVKKFDFQKVFDLDRMTVNGELKDYKPQVFAVTSIDICSF